MYKNKKIKNKKESVVVEIKSTIKISQREAPEVGKRGNKVILTFEFSMFVPRCCTARFDRKIHNLPSIPGTIKR